MQGALEIIVTVDRTIDSRYKNKSKKNIFLFKISFLNKSNLKIFQMKLANF